MARALFHSLAGWTNGRMWLALDCGSSRRSLARSFSRARWLAGWLAATAARCWLSAGCGCGCCWQLALLSLSSLSLSCSLSLSNASSSSRRKAGGLKQACRRVSRSQPASQPVIQSSSQPAKARARRGCQKWTSPPSIMNASGLTRTCACAPPTKNSLQWKTTTTTTTTRRSQGREQQRSREWGATEWPIGQPAPAVYLSDFFSRLSVSLRARVSCSSL